MEPPPISPASEILWCGARNGRARERLPGGEPPGDGVDLRDLDRLGEGRRGEDTGDTARQHRLAGARGTDEQYVVRAAGGYLERSFGGILAADVGEVEVRAMILMCIEEVCLRRDRRYRILTPEVPDDAGQGG